MILDVYFSSFLVAFSYEASVKADISHVLWLIYVASCTS